MSLLLDLGTIVAGAGALLGVAWLLGRLFPNSFPEPAPIEPIDRALLTGRCKCGEPILPHEPECPECWSLRLSAP